MPFSHEQYCSQERSLGLKAPVFRPQIEIDSEHLQGLTLDQQQINGLMLVATESDQSRRKVNIPSAW